MGLCPSLVFKDQTTGRVYPSQLEASFPFGGQTKTGSGLFPLCGILRAWGSFPASSSFFSAEPPASTHPNGMSRLNWSLGLSW